MHAVTAAAVHPVTQALLVVAIVIIFVYALARRIPFSFRGGPVSFDVALVEQLTDTKATMTEIQSEVSKIHNAVNGVPKDQPPLVQRVVDVENLAHWSANALHSLSKHVGLELPAPPDRRAPKIDTVNSSVTEDT